MNSKNSIEFISFKDGICDIYTEDEEGNNVYKYKKLAFANRVLGFKRYFTAAANQIKVNRVIRIPIIENIGSHDTLEINRVKYDIELIQEIFDSNPRSIDLTLSKLEAR